MRRVRESWRLTEPISGLASISVTVSTTATRSTRPTRGRWCEPGVSPAEDLFLDPALDGFPRLQLDGTSLDRGDAASDLDLPRRLGIWVGRSVETSEQFRREFGARLDIELEGVREDRFSSLGHRGILRPPWPPNKRLLTSCFSGT